MHCVRGKPDHRFGDFFGLAHPAHRQTGCDGAHVGDARAHHHRGLDPARRHGIDADAMRCVFQRSRARERNHGSLGRRVKREPGIGIAHAAHRGVVDDRSAAASRQHGCDLGLHRQEYGADIRAKHAVEHVVRLLGERCPPLLNAGVVESDVEAAEMVAGPGDGTAQLRRHRHVGLDERRTRAGALACRGGATATPDVSPDDRNVGAAPREGERGRLSDPGGCPRDQDGLVRERCGVCAVCGRIKHRYVPAALSVMRCSNCFTHPQERYAGACCAGPCFRSSGYAGGVTRRST